MGSTSSESSCDSSSDSSSDSSVLNIQTQNAKKKGKKRQVHHSFIQNPKQRAQTTYNRKKGILKKINQFDLLTGSQSAFLTLGRKGKLSTQATPGSELAKLLPSIEDLIENKKVVTKDAETMCHLKVDLKINPHYASAYN